MSLPIMKMSMTAIAFPEFLFLSLGFHPISLNSDLGTSFPFMANELALICLRRFAFQTQPRIYKEQAKTIWIDPGFGMGGDIQDISFSLSLFWNSVISYSFRLSPFCFR